MVITKIAAAVKTRGRYNVFVDGEYSFSLAESQVVDLGVRQGLVVTAEELERLKGESEFGKCYVRAIDLISRRMRSEKEIRDYGWRKGWPEGVQARVIERLRERGYLDDEKFAGSFVRSRAGARGFSRRRMEQELRKKGIEAGVIERVIGGFDESESLRELVRKRRGRYDSEERLVRYLAGRGFRYEDVRAVLDEIE